MKLAALLVALALAVPATSYAQVFRSEPTVKAKPKATPKAKAKPKARAKSKPRAEPAAVEAEPEPVASKSKSRNVDKVAETDVVVIIDGE